MDMGKNILIIFMGGFFLVFEDFFKILIVKVEVYMWNVKLLELLLSNELFYVVFKVIRLRSRIFMENLLYCICYLI